jgi:hypothetical protein
MYSESEGKYSDVDRNVGLEVPLEVVTSIPTFWSVTPCGLLKINRRFGRTYLLNFQGNVKVKLSL